MEKNIFSERQVWKLMLPLMLEQLLTQLMGTADTMMVSTAGSAAISAVSLVDSINVLMLNVFSAMATGGSIICAQYLGRHEPDQACEAGKQMLLSVFAISSVCMAVFALFRRPLLNLIFGQVEADVMDSARVYLLITAISYPFIALYNAGAALFRVEGNSRLPLRVSTICNLVNIAGNAVLIFGFGMGAAGAALATLVSRILCAVIVLICLAQQGRAIVMRDYRHIRPNWRMIQNILKIGVPTGVENGMFQFGKLTIQSSVSLLGKISIAAHAMTTSLESLTGVGQIGVGLAMMTVVGQCMGAGRPQEARRHIVRMTGFAEAMTIAVSLIALALTKWIARTAGMESAAADLTFEMMFWITVFKPLFWTASFIPAYGMRAAGDVRFSMIVSSVTMWSCRVLVTTLLIRVFHIGAISVWIGMFSDWFVRGVIFTIRFLSGKWADKRVLST